MPIRLSLHYRLTRIDCGEMCRLCGSYVFFTAPAVDAYLVREFCSRLKSQSSRQVPS